MVMVQVKWPIYIVNSVDKTKLSFQHVDKSPCLWLQLVTEVPVGIWIRIKFKVEIDRSVKTPSQEYGVIAGS